MAATVLTVEDVLRSIKALKEDIELVTEMEKEWRSRKNAFPFIYEGVVKQEEALHNRIAQLRTIKIETTLEEIEKMSDETEENIQFEQHTPSPIKSRKKKKA
ncbi:MAG: hypothetical protein ABIH42_00630 [Planctomycetota bacterium]